MRCLGREWCMDHHSYAECKDYSCPILYAGQEWCEALINVGPVRNGYSHCDAADDMDKYWMYGGHYYDPNRYN